jgi:hypothetical protein
MPPLAQEKNKIKNYLEQNISLKIKKIKEILVVLD